LYRTQLQHGGIKLKEPKFYRKFDYDKRLLPNLYLASLEEGVTSIEGARKKTGASIGYPGWGLVYYFLLSHLSPTKFNHIIETGTNQGCTTIILAQALKDSGCSGHIHTIELDKATYDIALENLNKANVADHVTAINGDVKFQLPEVLKKVNDISIAFLDASHLYDDVIFEFEAIYSKLNDQSLIVFDNTYLIAERHEDQRVHGALKHIHKEYGGNLINFETVSWFTPGMAIWQNKPFNDR
jgi:predicted O-methyltransferase YrrM